MQLVQKAKENLLDNWFVVFSGRALALWFAAFLICALAGPFGTYVDLELSRRFSYWALVFGASAGCGLVSRIVTQHFVSIRHSFVFDLSVMLVTTLCLAPFVWYIGRFFDTPFMLNSIPLSRIFFYVLMINFGIFCIQQIAIHGLAQSRRSSGAIRAEPLREPRLQRKISGELSGEIIRLSSNDHFVEVVTTDGSAMLRMRLVDAIEAMEPVDGFCCHRSHWVVTAHVVEMEQETPHKFWLLLDNGERVPVSRKYRDSVKHAGF